MFNTGRYNTRDVYVRTDVAVTEKRAPTDESIRLLKEMQEKSMDSVLSCVKVEDNEFRATWWTYTDNYSYNDKVICRFKLNGKDYEFRIDLPCKYTKTSDIAPFVKDAIRDELAKILTMNLFTENGKIIRDIYA